MKQFGGPWLGLWARVGGDRRTLEKKPLFLGIPVQVGAGKRNSSVP